MFENSGPRKVAVSRPNAVECRRGDLTEYGFNPTVTAIKPPVYRGFFWCSGRGEKEVRKNDGETGSDLGFRPFVASTSVEPILL